MFESGIKLFDSGVKLFELDVKTALGQLDWSFFVVYTYEEKVDFRKEKPMTAFFHVRVETHTDCTGVAETPAVCMGVADMTSICTGVAETQPDCNRVAGTPLLQ